MSPRFPDSVNRARRAVEAALDPAGLNLVACSGGADSLALAAAAAFHQRRLAGENPVKRPDEDGPSAQASSEDVPEGEGAGATARVGAVVIDHQLHPGSEAVTATAAAQLRGLGLDPVLSVQASVDPASGEGPEAAARTARYRAFAEALAQTGATRILLAHTRDDQAEQVLLGLARGSGTRSLAGIPAVRGPFRRPLLGLTREETEEICAHAQLRPWQDPANSDPRFLRSKVRTEILPYLEAQLSGSIRESLARTAQIAAEDADYLDQQAKDRFAQLLHDPGPESQLRMELSALLAVPPAIRRRVIALAVVAAGGANPSFERLMAVEKLLGKTGSAGPIELEGGVRAHRGTRGSPDYAKLVIVPRLN
ncbi:tRNA lysidine(34) synthetase TilS [Nesterenkonia aurantiaca]|uniref:tRNA(Ile)-lysidine synthase n=1 Tax=Nesterenkonia aurantiaca TaxID=1436010 RepID=A0A4R7G845_9MICC|nr:tRNA lysidine(34) synthetase TilS [Nesterenkonia aurantiaca]TDS87698.1 tRNA(Ile)-lysidine synthase [Nesterenkonia aurantiaca]